MRKEAIVNLGGIRAARLGVRAGHRKKPIYLDVRVATIAMSEAPGTSKQFLCLREKACGGLEFETYVSVPGARISEEHPMIGD